MRIVAENTPGNHFV